MDSVISSAQKAAERYHSRRATEIKGLGRPKCLHMVGRSEFQKAYRMVKRQKVYGSGQRSK